MVHYTFMELKKKMSQSFKDIFKSSYVMDKQTIFFFCNTYMDVNRL